MIFITETMNGVFVDRKEKIRLFVWDIEYLPLIKKNIRQKEIVYNAITPCKKSQSQNCRKAYDYLASKVSLIFYRILICMTIFGNYYLSFSFSFFSLSMLNQTKTKKTKQPTNHTNKNHSSTCVSYMILLRKNERRLRWP